MAVIVVTLLTVAAGWAVAWRSFTELRQERIALAISEGGKVLLSFEDHAANLFDAGDTRLRSLRSVLGNLGTGERLRQHLADIRLPGDETLSRSTVITDRAGAIVFESSFATPPAASLADRPYFRHLKETVRDELVIDSTSLGILSGKPRFRLVRPILADGRFDGVIAQVLEPDHLAGFYRSFDLGPDSVLFVLNVTDHRYLARLPVGDNRLYDGPLAGARIWEHLAEHPSGTFTNTSPVDGIPRYYLYRRLTDYPVVIALGIAEHTILDSLAGARNNLILQSGLFSAAAGAFCVLLLMIMSKNRILALAEDGLRNRARLQGEIERLSHVGGWEWDGATGLSTISTGLQRIHGNDQSRLTKDEFLAMLPAEDRDRVARTFAEALAGGAYDIEHGIVRADTGAARIVQCHAESIRDGDGRVIKMVGAVQDVTERRRLEEAARHDLAERQRMQRRVEELAEFNAKVIAESVLGILAYKADGPCVLANAAAARILGGTPEQLAALNFRRIASWHRSGLLAAAEKVLLSGASAHMSVQFISTFGRKVWLDVDLSTFSNGDEPHLLFAFHDVFEQKLAEEALRAKSMELERSNADLERFAYVASHDLQTPLRTISSYTQLLERRYRGRFDADADDFIGFIVDGAKHMSRLITDLLDYARVGSQGRPLAPVPSRRRLDEALAVLKPAIDETGARITIGELPMVLADDHQMVSLWQNLVGNALKYRHPERPPEITITAEPHDAGHWRFGVRDNGIGIEAEYFHKIFEIFQRLYPGGQYEGTGVGLAICQRIVHRFGGEIWVTSTLGEGSTFYFTIAAVDEA